MAVKKDLLSAVKGHDEVIKKLRTAVTAGNLAPTLIFVGPSGVGKRKVAIGLAQLLVCTQPALGFACGKCGPCIRIENRQSESLLEIEPQGASIKIEQTRQVIKFISLAQVGEARVIIFNDAHLLNAQAANSLLKSLEEPPPATWFILVAPTASAILPTLRSRAQIVRFGTLAREVIADLSASGPEWAIESAMGRMDLIEELGKEEVVELRAKAFEFWSEGADIHPTLTNRESALWVTRFWLGLLRDSWFYKRGLTPIIHADQMSIIKNLGARSEAQLAQLGRDVYNLERDIQHNADYHLAFENFIRNQLHATLD
jgi:DNA polymerase III subunit delta'